MSKVAKAIFIHIPRTGGTSIRKMFGFNYLGSPAEFANPPIDFSLHPRFTIPQHAKVVKDMMTLEEWNSYYKFIVVRNPWERVLSHYLFLKNAGHTDIHFHDWVIRFKGCAQWKKAYSVWFRDDNGNILVDEIVRFEDFENSMKIIAKRFSLSKKIPKLNKTVHDHYSSYYTEESKKIVGDLYEDDINYFGYKFDEAPVIKLN